MYLDRYSRSHIGNCNCALKRGFASIQVHITVIDSRGGPCSTRIKGKEAIQILDECGDLLEIWQWALEHALGVYGIVADRSGFHYLVAKPLKDGQVILNAPAGKNRPRGNGYSRNFDDPVIPDCAKPITEAEAKLRVIFDGLEQEAA